MDVHGVQSRTVRRNLVPDAGFMIDELKSMIYFRSALFLQQSILVTWRLGNLATSFEFSMFESRK